MAMHILISGTFWTQPNVGSGQYLHGLLRWLPLVAPQHRYTLLLPASGDVEAELPRGITPLRLRTPFDRARDGRSKNLAKLWFEQVAVPQAAHLVRQQQRKAADVSGVLLHVPYFAPPLRNTVPVITTIPDIIPLVLPEYRGGVHIRAYMALVSVAARRATHTITFSRYSANDIAARLRIPLQRITPTLLAAAERYMPPPQPELAAAQVARRYGVERPFIYYVGGLDVRKNVDVLVRALALLHQRGDPSTRGVTLAIAGRSLGSDPRLFPDLDRVIANQQMGEWVRRIEVPYEDGPLLYQACTLFAFPSHYEGFGLPPLEAMACGAPVIVSSASSLPEVVGDAALCVAPDDVAAWADAFSRLLRDAELRSELRERGLVQAAQFSWRRVAEETAQVYATIASE
jgi:glycosyltransferase involved in cell wall biosynthesis